MPEIRLDDTIAALATPVGESGLAVIRISGKEAFKIIGKVFRSPKGRPEDFASHTLHLGRIEGRDGTLIDQAMIALFRGPGSYTGEDTVELSCHGGLVVVRSVLDRVIQAGARHAEAGEFTKRAFLNGRLDLTQAEAVSDLIRAKSRKAAEAAALQLSGQGLSAKLKNLKERMLKMYAHMEAFLDFPDEHLEVYSDQEFARGFSGLRGEMTALLEGFQRGALLREGLTVALAGKPNVGKSSLFNALLARDRALVSEFAGTTRDVIEEALEIRGFYMRLLDTAGLSGNLSHPLERMGMERAKTALAAADLTLFLVDASAPPDTEDAEAFKAVDLEKPVAVILHKIDLGDKISGEQTKQFGGNPEMLKVSSKTGAGLEGIEAWIEKKILSAKIEATQAQLTRLRHKNGVEQALAAVQRAEKGFFQKQSLEFVVLEMKEALDALRELVGEVYSEDLLDVVFSEFCIGK